MADTVRKGEGGATGGALEKSESRHCRHHRHHHGRSQADTAARVPGRAGALPRPRSQRKGARLVLAWGAAAFGEGPIEAVLPRGARAGWELGLSRSPNRPREILLGEELLPRGGAAKLQRAARLFGNWEQLAGRAPALSPPHGN